MKNILLILLLSVGISGYSQKKMFRLYTDSAALVRDANELIANFSKHVNAIKPAFESQPTAILNTRPFLIFYSSKTNIVNLPIWSQVAEPQKKFFYDLGGNEKTGMKMFAHFFNGFYLPHELGHALQKATNKKAASLYENEYFANTVAILYWRKINRTKELRQCYRFAKKLVSQIPDPVPTGADPIKYFNENYNALGVDPYKYGYFQFAQFVKIYEDKSLKTFDEFIRDFLTQ